MEDVEVGELWKSIRGNTVQAGDRNIRQLIIKIIEERVHANAFETGVGLYATACHEFGIDYQEYLKAEK